MRQVRFLVSAIHSIIALLGIKNELRTWFARSFPRSREVNKCVPYHFGEEI